MKKLFTASVLASVVWLAGCATPESRVKANESLVSSWPADVQQNVRAGKIAVGYTRDMVRVALGEPDRLATRTTAEGQSEVWVYFDKGPKFSFGVGLGSFGRHSAVGGGVTVGDTGWRDEEMMRVIFAGERVSAIELRK